MATNAADGYRGTATRTHSKDDALSRREFELLVEGCHELDPAFSLQAKFVVLVAGRLGLRAGEIAHMRESWVDWRRNMICIPRHQPCESGRNDGVCGHCRLNAEQRVKHADDLALEDALEMSWSAKTDAAAREIPFDSDPRAELVVERFFDRFDRWPLSQTIINRRVERAAEAADEIDADDVYPHALRASCATELAARGLDIFSLKSMMGWSNLSTAKCYVSSSGERTAQALRDLR